MTVHNEMWRQRLVVLRRVAADSSFSFAGSKGASALGLAADAVVCCEEVAPGNQPLNHIRVAATIDMGCSGVGAGVASSSDIGGSAPAERSRSAPTSRGVLSAGGASPIKDGTDASGSAGGAMGTCRETENPGSLTGSPWAEENTIDRPLRKIIVVPLV